jgi:hypothetical protein
MEQTMRSTIIAAVFALSSALLVTAQPPGSRADGPQVRGDTSTKVIVVEVESPKPVEGRDVINATLLFDKAVANRKGELIVDLADGSQAHLRLLPVDQDPDGKNLKPGQPTTRLLVQWSPKKDNLRPDQLKGRPARLVSNDGPPDL